MARLSLDQLYKMTAHIYAEQNFHRPISATFLHFVEVCGMLTVLARKKKRDSFSFEDSLCKSLGWFFPLMAKCGVISVEAIVFRKFPYVCPYCRNCPHTDMTCKAVRGTESTVDHAALRKKFDENKIHTPAGINEWQSMFQEIYPRAPDTNRSAIGLMEELGELAEAIRVFERHPRFLAGEAADTFSYIMGLANEYSIQKQMTEGVTFDFENEFLRRYPGLCLACGNPVCTCPSVPAATIGRMAKELDIGEDEVLFSSHFSDNDGGQLARDVLTSVGGLESLTASIPLDKGQIGSSLIVLCLQLSIAVADIDRGLSQKLKDCANVLANNQTEAGQQHSPDAKSDVVRVLADAFRLASAHNKPIDGLSPESVGYRLVKSASRLRVLLVGVSPIGEMRINVEKEVQEVKNAIDQSGRAELIEVDDIIGCTINDLRRLLFEKEYSFIHFFGHGFAGGVVLADSDAGPADVQLDALRQLLVSHPSVKGVLLNSCESLKSVEQPIGAFTIGMEDEIDDDVAVSFAVGFYDAISRELSLERAIEEGQNNVRLHHDNFALRVKLLKSKS